MSRTLRNLRNLALLATLAAAGGLAKRADAAPITTAQSCFTGPTSDATPASYLTGCANVTDYGNGTATIDLSNTSSPPYTLSSFGFSPTSDISSITLLSTNPAYSTTVQTDQKMDGFTPNFGYVIDFGQGNTGIVSGNNVLLTFSYTGKSGATVTADDFVPDIAAHYTRGPGDDSAFVRGGPTPVPEPSTAALAGLGGMLLLYGATRKRSS